MKTPPLVLLTPIVAVLSACFPFENSCGAPVRLNLPLGPTMDVEAFRIVPDGSRVVYRADQATDEVWELFSVPLGGGLPTRLNGPLPATADVQLFDIYPSANGAHVVFFANRATDGHYDGFGVPVTGGTAAPLDGLTLSSPFRPTPDGTRMVFITTGSSDDPYLGTVQVNSVPIAGGPSTHFDISVPAGVGVTDFAFAPDGATLVYRSYDTQLGIYELFSVATAGGVPIKLAGEPTVGESVQAGYLISPDGGTVVFQLYRSETASWEIFSVPVGGGTAARLGPPAPAPGYLERSYRLTPDGSRVVWLAGPELGPFELLSVHLAGGPPVTLNGPLGTNGGVLDFQLTSDGSRAIYLGDEPANQTRELFSVPVAGGAVVKLNGPLAQQGRALLVGITPDSTRLVYRGGTESVEKWEVFAVPSAGGASVKLNLPLAAEESIFEAQLSPDGARVVYRVDSEDHHWQLFSVALSGGPPVSLTAGVTAPATDDDGQLALRISPSSTHVVYLADQITPGAYELFSVPVTGESDPNYATFAASFGLTTPPDGDEDNDGLRNELEYVLGTNPVAPDAGVADLPSLAQAAGSHEFRFTLSSTLGSDVRLDIETSADLVAWEVLATRAGPLPWSGPAGIVVTPVGAGRETVTFNRPTGPETTRAYRVRTTLVP